MRPFKVILNIRGGEFGRPWTEIVFEYDGRTVCFHGDEKDFATNNIIRRIVAGDKGIDDASLLDSYIQNAELSDPLFDNSDSQMMDGEYGELILKRQSITLEWRWGEIPNNWPNISSIITILRTWAADPCSNQPAKGS